MAFPKEIFTARLRFRPPTEADAEQVFARYSHDPDVTRYMSWTPHRSVADTLEYLRQRVIDNGQNASVEYLLFSRETDKLLGSVGGRIQGSLVQFGYCLARDAWGRGFATEAALAFVTAAMNEPEIWRLQAFCDLENRASARVLEKSGLTCEGVLRRYMVLPNIDDAPRDVFCYAIVREVAIAPAR